MKKIVIFGLLLLIGLNGWGQKKLHTKTKIKVKSLKKASNKIYKNLNRYVPTHFLLNKTFADTATAVYQVSKLLKRDSAINADLFFDVLQNLNWMAINKEVVDLDSLYHDVRTSMGKIEFNRQREVYPVGVIDYNYNWMNTEKEMKFGNIQFQNKQFFLRGNPQHIFHKKNIQLIAPLFNRVSLEQMGIVFRKKYFYSNVHQPADVKNIVVIHNGRKQIVRFGEIYKFQPNHREFQNFTFKIYFRDGDSVINRSSIKTPELADEKPIPESITITGTPTFKQYKEEKIGNLKLKAYIVPSCSNNGDTYSPPKEDTPWVPSITTYYPRKPYVLVTGFRPPVFGQGPKKTWKHYNTWHDNLLNQLRKNGYDIILIQYNMSAHPNKLGISEAADLLIKYIEDLNAIKKQHGYGYNENVIQGSSMGASVTRLALLKMENKHLHNDSYPNPHCRLFISYDGNYYGANLPLAYQFQIYSASNYPFPALATLVSFIPYVGEVLAGADVLLQLELYATLQQKAVQELLMYHAKGMGYASDVSTHSIDATITPTHTYLRQEYLNKLNQLYNSLGYYPHGKLFTPMPSATRNVAISLGKYKGTDDHNTQGLHFHTAGENWRNVNLSPFYRHILRAAQYQNSKLIFKRQLGLDFWFIHLNVVNQTFRVKNIQEIDNAAGSYLKGGGDIITLANTAYGLINFDHPFSQRFSHKSVLSALAINKSIWPSNGSHTLNLQSEDLMFNKFSYNPAQPSKYYGYPNLGHPNDHFDITPFEAIYCSDYIIPHINLKDVPSGYIDHINEFIKNEVEPCYLYLQNQHLGSQARPDYTYKSRRRANNVITTGHLVTPKTDPGDYVVEPNADLILEAGEEIDLKPGTHIKAGAKAHLWIHYEGCNRYPRPCSVSSLTQTNTIYTNNPTAIQRKSEQEKDRENQLSQENAVKVFPNPTHTSFTIKSAKDNIRSIDIYSLSGKRIDRKDHIDTQHYHYSNQLENGTYILIIKTKDGDVYHKKIVIL